MQSATKLVLIKQPRVGFGGFADGLKSLIVGLAICLMRLDSLIGKDNTPIFDVK